MKPNPPPIVQREEFLRGVLGELNSAIKPVAIVGCRAFVVNPSTDDGNLGTIEFEFDTAGHSEEILVRVINKRIGFVDSQSFMLSQYLDSGMEKREEGLLRVTRMIENQDDDTLRWDAPPSEKNLRNLREAIVQYLSVWL